MKTRFARIEDTLALLTSTESSRDYKFNVKSALPQEESVHEQVTTVWREEAPIAESRNRRILRATLAYCLER
jgi:hypothetical protein